MFFVISVFFNLKIYTNVLTVVLSFYCWFSLDILKKKCSFAYIVRN